ncbi:hypothetical protein [Bifidobacterium jacchi]|uniref:PhnA protein n=1 Tax=Bifidobacterium jacchi TaxID=2490545 RepID=A0A5N5RN67_9BIFI|nr:hypothetical protein [Bifidobacterium jacchi]KAB5608400.1 hypothetical protein EHS19_01900 [Bifidobacterium jacchi]
MAETPQPDMRRFTLDVTLLRDSWRPVGLIADRHASIADDANGRRSPASTAMLPFNLAAFQIRDDMAMHARRLIHAGRLHPTRHMTVRDLYKGVLANLPRYETLPELPLLADETHRLANRVRLLLDPPSDVRMIGWCPACATELRADEQEIAGGYIPCPACGGEYRIKDIHQLDMLRLRVSGVKGTPAQLSRLLEPWGISIKAATIRQWAKRGIIQPIGHDGTAPVFLIWDVWQAHTRLAGYDKARRSRRHTRP